MIITTLLSGHSDSLQSLQNNEESESIKLSTTFVAGTNNGF